MLEKLGKDKPLPEIIAEEIVNLIIKENLQGGDKLPSEAELSSSLGVGRSTIREAIKILISKNIVMIKRGLGTYVSEKIGISEDPLGFRFIQDKKKLLIDTLEMRLLIEPKIASDAALMATEEEIRNIEKLCDEVEELILNGGNHIEKDIEFHTQIAKSSRNLVITTLLPVVSGFIPAFTDMTKCALKEETVQTHREVMKAIKERNQERAFECMMNHISYHKELIENL
ncbi:MAG: FadR/GntR family transcriptional regulator [Cellulosilyticaceae bacterium]